MIGLVSKLGRIPDQQTALAFAGIDAWSKADPAPCLDVELSEAYHDYGTGSEPEQAAALKTLIRLAGQGRYYRSESDHPVLEALDVRARLMSISDALLLDAVRLERKRGCSWTYIGSELGVSRQAARARFAHRI